MPEGVPMSALLQGPAKLSEGTWCRLEAHGASRAIPVHGFPGGDQVREIE